MINSIYGKLSDRKASSIYILTNGLEWNIETTTESIQALPPVGEDVRIFTYLYHREDQLKLYGFLTQRERSLFLELIKISGIGTRQALRILSGSNTDNLIKMIEDENITALSHLPGIGKKTAQKILFDLKGKIDFSEQEEHEGKQDLVNALVEMGFEKKKAKDVIDRLYLDFDGNENNDANTYQDIFKKAIIELS